MDIDDLKDLDKEIRKEIEGLQRVTREQYGGKKFAQTQYIIGKTLLLNGEIGEAINTLENIQRLDDSVCYVLAQMHIGEILYNKNDFDGAQQSWSKIQKEDSLKLYGIFQTKISDILVRKNKTNDALLVLKNILELDDIENCSRAQLKIGYILKDTGNYEEAVSYWSKIKKKDNAIYYVLSQLEIGEILRVEGELDKALNIFREIYKSSSENLESLVRFRIGQVYIEKGDTREASKFLEDIERSQDLYVYAMAKIEIGKILKESGNIDGALDAWYDFKKEDNNKAYSVARLLIGDALVEKNSIDEALEAWRSIDQVDSLAEYMKCQMKIGTTLIDNEEKNEIMKAKSAFEVASEYYPYESSRYIKICNLLVNDKEGVGRFLLKLLRQTIETIDLLTLDFNNSMNVSKYPERKLAHYTSTFTMDKLLNIENEKGKASSFRLNTVSNFNDPSEGHLLNSYLNDIKEGKFYAPDFDKKFHAFVSCFTFNHDSLNQFRLYGKENNKEASGVSFVFKKEFFQSKSLLGGISLLSPTTNIQTPNGGFEIIEDNQSHIDFKNMHVDRYPVIRCIYIEPVSEYVQLAQRNQLTFYREFEAEENPEEKWKIYEKMIDDKTKKVVESLKTLRTTYRTIKDKYSGSFETNSILIDEILLPLKYLIKHSAFQEEQECRMIHITSLKDPKVKMDFGKFLYVEYEANVKAHLDKIYIAPAATQYQPYLAKLLCNTDVKIELSNNPYRQT
ncbi:hypothetical protein AOC03_08205 [Psychrobacter urativorans]|uniref:Uncharacterized protein n=2 Tax=Psychrobacter urativorans TaxID=45610 RepID=A0A0M3V8Z1_9GAMM|nr:hypothetical protein AOC03_08205 [Psychrobacter urativorans]